MKLVALAMLAGCTKPARPPECRGVVEHLAKIIHAEPKGAWFDRALENCTDGPWTWAHKRCVIEAKNQKEIDACVLPVAPRSIAPAPPANPATPPNKPRGADCLVGDDDCAATMKCVPWTTEGGERHATCEIPCGPKPDYACPDGTGCVHQGGGPSEVCLERK